MALLLAVSAHSSALAAGWISPTGYSDPGGQWTTPANACDGNTTTYASDSPVAGWADPLVLTLSSSTTCSAINVYTDFGFGRVDEVSLDVELYPANTWSNVYVGAVANDAWSEVDFPATSISAARFTYHYVGTDWTFWLYELKLYQAPAQVLPPTCASQAAASVEQTTAILPGLVTSDGGVPCQWRFQYGLTSSYTTNTAWTGSVLASNAFGVMITGLSSNTTYHFRAQVQNSAGIGSGSDSTFTTGVPGTGWISPTGYSDPNGAWSNQIYAFDGNLATCASCTHLINAPLWSPLLYLTHDSMTCEKIRFYARATADIDMADVDVYLNGTWTTVYSNSFPNEQWVEASFPMGTVTQARVSFHINSANYGEDWDLYEFDFHQCGQVHVPLLQSRLVFLAV